MKGLEELRSGGLSDENPETFSKKLHAVHAWDEALGQVGGGPHAKALADRFHKWDEEVMEHVWYLAKEGLVTDPVSSRHTHITELGIRILEWVSERA